MSTQKVTINLVVLNGEKYIHHCLDGILAQTYPHQLIEFNILDNGSTDGTKSVIGNWKLKIGASSFAAFNLIESKQNLGMWPGQEELLKYSNGKYVLAMAVDVILDKDFIKNAVEAMEKDERIGALQAKIYKYDIQDLEIVNCPDFVEDPRFLWNREKLEIGETIDTCGFQIFKSRRIINIGHGQIDSGQFSEQKEIFGVEGAAPFFRREAIEGIRINGEFCDHDFFWYGDDLDFAWRMNMFGWRQVFVPSVVAWHDRQTTKTLRKSQADFIKIRRQILPRKRRLDWINTRFTIIKNDYIINILKDLPSILRREIVMFGYLLIFEPVVFIEIFKFIRLLSKMLRKRKEVMRGATVRAQEIHKWFK